ncbi:MAG TPA: glycosyltransferase [Methylocella sp.]|nr:glycosyltransferase [Methylocella sp.]
MAPIYEHRYVEPSVYGNVIALLRNHITNHGVHLDIGCGYGAIAEPVRDKLRLDYMGFDLAQDGLDSLRARGFDTHQIDLLCLDRAEAIIREVLGDRQIASLTLLDTLEHMVNGPAVIAMLRRLADQSAAPFVVSVPNITHKDIALKLLTGRWDVTEAGLLDRTHVEGYSHARLENLMAASGWLEVAQNDWLLEHSDQHFPESMPTLDVALPLGHFLRRLVEQANPHLTVNQFVRAYQPDRFKPLPLLHDRSESLGPLFTILIAIESCPPSADLQRLLNLLDQQVHRDFEITILLYPNQQVGPSTDYLNSFPPSLRQLTAVVTSSRLNRAGALNEVINRIAGRYIIFLSETDLVAKDWLSTLAELAKQKPHVVLRVGAKASKPDTKSFGADILPFDASMIEKVGAFAVPAAVFNHLGFKFDESLIAGEIEEAIAQAVMFFGLIANDKVLISPGGSTVESNDSRKAEERISVFHTILSRINTHPLLLPPGSANKIKCLIDTSEEFSELRNFGLLRYFLEKCDYPLSLKSHEHRDLSYETRPFLSVITRTMGTRNRTLRDTLMSLAGQSSENFELVVVVHSELDEKLASVKQLVAEFPASFLERTTVIQCARPGRAAPLNDALAYARGKYLAVLDDDDFVFGHWIETFERLFRERPGAMLRATCTRQSFEAIYGDSDPVPRATTWFEMAWPSTYDAVSHLCANFTPTMSLAFPVEAFQVLNLRWDETLSTTEDWQLATLVAMNCGVVCAPDVTAVYRWWTNAESSLFTHDAAEWSANRARIIASLNSQPILLPPGSAERICNLIASQEELLALKAAQAAGPAPKKGLAKLKQRLRTAFKGLSKARS